MDGRIALPKDTLLDGSYRIERVIGAGGFGITYEAEDVKLKTRVAIKEYCPEEFGYRDASLSVRPKSERQTKTFEWGRSSFLQEAQTLARFRHPSVVQVTRVFEAYATAYMVMIFEPGQSFEKWLKLLGRLPTQGELDRIAGPLLDALELMHGENFLHRDIAPDNIIVRADGTPVLLDFGAARRAVAEESRSLTGIVKSGYSPQEQYATDGRLQGPWTDIYAFGATLYRAVTGKVPEESTLRAIDDGMPSAVSVGDGTYRPGFLLAIDSCLQVHHSARPQSVAQLRPVLFAPAPRSVSSPPIDTRKIGAGKPTRVPSTQRRTRLWFAVAAIIVAASGGVVGGLQYSHRQAEEQRRLEADSKRKADQDLQRQADAEAAIKRNVEEEARARMRAEAAAAAKRREELAEARARAAEAKRRAEDAEAEAKRLADADVAKKKADEEGTRKKAEARIKSEEETKRQADADAAARKVEEERLARIGADAEAKREAERIAVTEAEGARERQALVQNLRTELKRVGCYPADVHAGREWDTTDRAALTQFATSTKVALGADEPSTGALREIVARTKKVCPLQCHSGNIENNGKCVPSESISTKSKGQAQAVRAKKSPTPTLSDTARRPPSEPEAPKQRCIGSTGSGQSFNCNNVQK